MKLPELQIKKRILLTTTVAIVFSVIGVATAQEVQRTFTVINPQISVTLNPGGKTEGTTKVINETNSSLTFKIGVQDYTVIDSKGTPSLLPPNSLNSKYSASSWIGVSPSTFTLRPREKQVITYYVQTPPSARPGGHYAALVYTPVVNQGTDKTGGVVSAQIGSLFYIRINGPITESAEVTKFTTNSFQEYGPVKLLTQIKNLGDLHIRPQGQIKLTGLFGTTTQKITEANIFPETVRDVETSVGKTLMLGRYKAELLASYGVNNNLPLTATVYFWVFPWRLAIIIILVILAIILAYLYLKKRNKKGPKSHTEAEKAEEKEESKDTKEDKPLAKKES
jgi:hypothetical protein